MRASGERTLVFLSYWATNEPLTAATVVPTVRMVLQQGMVDRVVLCTVERGPGPVTPPLRIDGCVHLQWAASTFGARIFGSRRSCVRNTRCC
jgi:hypothetical protein